MSKRSQLGGGFDLGIVHQYLLLTLVNAGFEQAAGDVVSRLATVQAQIRLPVPVSFCWGKARPARS